ncbi:hypothetical protein [Saccharothrix obliqua]|uniref:hypothetical protein n=1 Tax=Saccharothrix obliqua TaxID=2861747 RepID=UPI001C5EB394|nr:hypothetical protein [Saccharothrix obliqua]MBW4715673.1 hypothetical protein [Saccharothrix obliqua]
MSQPTTSTDLEIEVGYNQFYIYAVAPWDESPDGHNAVMDALNDAYASERYVGLSAGLIDVLTPAEWNFHTPMRVETWSTEPPADTEDWDHVVDADLDIPHGTLMFEGSGGRPPIPCEVPPGRYRARIAGRGYDLAKARTEGMDAYRLQLWPRNSAHPPTLKKRWTGWQPTSKR